ncbi:MAG TPA: hypothetical protein VFV70_07930 [Hyphomonadaceae bacterium]|nr:hypothetical protein [Hyphomonadaceae bacterium]
MRIVIAAAILALSACEPAKPAGEAAAPAAPGEAGNANPGASSMPAPVGPTRTYEAMSKTAMSVTPGVLIMTPTQQKSENLPAGMVFAFGNGIIYETTSMPGGAAQGERPFDWTKVMIDPSGPVEASRVEMFAVDRETVPPDAPNGGLCAKTSFLATYIVRTPGAEDITIAAFQGDQWPPKDEAALCGTFTYANVH